MNAALKTFCGRAMGTVLSWPDDQLAQQDFQGTSGSKKPLSKFSLLRFDTHRDLRRLNYRRKIQVHLHRPTSVPQTQAP